MRGSVSSLLLLPVGPQGIPLAEAVAIALDKKYKIDVPKDRPPERREGLRSFICTASGAVCLPLKQGFKFRFHGNRFP